MYKDDIKALEALLQTPKHISVIGHINPDGDAVGSCMAWGLFLKKLGHRVNIILPNAYPDFLSWVPHQEEMLIHSDLKEDVNKFIQDSDLIFTLDFNSLSRVGKDLQQVLEAIEKSFVMIDHHLAPDDYAELTFSNPKFGSTAEFVYAVIESLEQTDLIDKDIASCLYLGIMTDSGSFKFPSTTSRTHRTVANLMDKGADAAKIQQQTFDSNSYSRLKLLGKAMENLVYMEEYNTAYISLSQCDLDQHHFQKGDTEGFVNYGLSIKNVNLAAIFKEDLQQGIVKISLRSKGDLDVNLIAREHFSGGGHKNAAGGKSELSLKDTIIKFESLVKAKMND
jgi:phosphoesterase RecJ-like protein